MAHEMQAKPGELALPTYLRVRKPDRRHQIAERQLGEHARVDLVGLARQRREPLHPLRISDQHIPALRLERVMDEARTVHRLHHRPHRPAVFRRDALGQTAQAVGVKRRRQLVDQLPLIGDQADVDTLATQIQPNMQHDVRGLLPGRSSVTTRACHRRGPPSSHSVAVVCYRAVRAVALRARAEATGYLAIPLLLCMEGRSEPVGSTLRNSLVFAGFGVCLHKRPQQRRIGRGVADRPPRRRDGGSGAHPPLPHRVTTCSSSRPRGQPLAVGSEVFRQP